MLVSNFHGCGTDDSAPSGTGNVYFVNETAILAV